MAQGLYLVWGQRLPVRGGHVSSQGLGRNTHGRSAWATEAQGPGRPHAAKVKGDGGSRPRVPGEGDRASQAASHVSTETCKPRPLASGPHPAQLSPEPCPLVLPASRGGLRRTGSVPQPSPFWLSQPTPNLRPHRPVPALASTPVSPSSWSHSHPTEAQQALFSCDLQALGEASFPGLASGPLHLTHRPEVSTGAQEAGAALGGAAWFSLSEENEDHLALSRARPASALPTAADSRPAAARSASNLQALWWPCAYPNAGCSPCSQPACSTRWPNGGPTQSHLHASPGPWLPTDLEPNPGSTRAAASVAGPALPAPRPALLPDTKPASARVLGAPPPPQAMGTRTPTACP